MIGFQRHEPALELLVFLCLYIDNLDGISEGYMFPPESQANL
jgi:hypothetical protein